MKVLILTASNPNDSAGIVANDLFNKYSSLPGNEVKMVVKEWGKYRNPNIFSVETRFEQFLLRIKNKIRSALLFKRFFKKNNIAKNEDYFFLNINHTIDFYTTNKILKNIDFVPELVIVLFMQSFLTFKNLFEIGQLTKAKILIYMMDMAPLTGGCHYAWGCQGYMSNCGNCPSLFSNNENDQSNLNLNFKKKYADKTNLIVLSASEYQHRQLLNSSLFKERKVGKVLIGINEKLFKPGNKKLIREKLNLPINKKIIFFGAVSPNVRRKGFNELTLTLNYLKSYNTNLDIHLVIAGKINTDLLTHLPFPHTCFGHLNFNQLAEMFQSSDLFLCPSIEDSGPMMINQAIMSGVPTVSFDIGVSLDLVKNGQTGYIAKKGDCNELAKGVLNLLNLCDSQYNTISEYCREFALREFTNDVQFKKINEFINE
jgi:glycosyltransferase involved in cell wall biosynthesis